MAVIRAFVVGVFSIFVATLTAQISRPTTTGAVELRIDANYVGSGTPASFSFRLINASGHDILLPSPSIRCEDPTMDGSIYLHNDFTPNDPSVPRKESFCTNDNMKHLPIFERIKSWKTLRPGESLTLSASRKRLGNEVQDPGSYDFWATYFPPAVEKDERNALLAKGIQIPREIAVSNHIVLHKTVQASPMVPDVSPSTRQ